MLLLVTSVIISTSAGTEPIVLGHGKADNAINLDLGSRQLSVSPHFGMNGFASPLLPQTMELDPGAMVTQSERLRDQSQSMRDQSKAIYNETAALTNKTSAFANQVEKDCFRAESLKDDASNSANSSLRSALLARDYLNDTRTLYNWTRISERKVEIATIMNIFGAMGAERTYDKVPTNMSDRVDTLEKRVSELEKMVKAK